MRGIVQVLVLAVLSESAVSGMAVTNRIGPVGHRKAGRCATTEPPSRRPCTRAADRQQPDCRSRQSGEVTLEGTAMSPLARSEATRLAETVLGVKSHSQPPERPQYANR